MHMYLRVRAFPGSYVWGQCLCINMVRYSVWSSKRHAQNQRPQKHGLAKPMKWGKSAAMHLDTAACFTRELRGFNPQVPPFIQSSNSGFLFDEK